jgi:hypothetical protein
MTRSDMRGVEAAEPQTILSGFSCVENGGLNQMVCFDFLKFKIIRHADSGFQPGNN